MERPSSSSLSVLYDPAHGREQHLAGGAAPGGFGGERVPFAQPPRELAERYFSVSAWAENDRGGHFLAVAEPQLLAQTADAGPSNARWIPLIGVASVSEFARQILGMLDAAPCPVSEVLIAHRADVDDYIETAATLTAVRRALSELAATGKAVHVPSTQLATRWPPQAFRHNKQSDLDDAVQLAIGAWASTNKTDHFDQIVNEAHLPKPKRHHLRPYVDIGWWGHLEPSPQFITQADLSIKHYGGW